MFWEVNLLIMKEIHILGETNKRTHNILNLEPLRVKPLHFAACYLVFGEVK